MLREAFSGARSRKSMNVERPSAKRTSMNPPPPILPAIRMRDGQRKTHGDSRIHRVTARLQDRDTGVGGVLFDGYGHGMPRVHR